MLIRCQVAKAVEDILYAATTEEGEQLLAAAIAGAPCRVLVLRQGGVRQARCSDLH